MSRNARGHCSLLSGNGVPMTSKLLVVNFIRKDVTKQNGRCSVGTFVTMCAMEIVDDYTNSKIF